ncbi:MAG: metallo-beta-lactamase family protein, partial [Halothiobacillaceae bacterium]
RAQELLFLFAKYRQVWQLSDRQIFLDSPLAIEATAIFLRHHQLFDAEAARLFQANQQHPLLPNLHFTRDASESMRLNKISGAIIIAGSGMCNGGRIVHHLKHNIWRRECHVLIVGFQALGTIGRALVDGARYIRIWGETIKVNATIHTIGGISAHADQQDLLTWYRHFQQRPRLVLVHGEPLAMQSLASQLRNELQAPVQIVRSGEKISLA